MPLTELIINYITALIATGGYASIVILMALESMVAPVPSEAVMPFAGFLVSSGQFSFWGVVIASSVGSLIGSLASYAIGAYGGRPIIDRWGKYLLLNHHHLELTEKFFARRGAAAIFWSRLIPVVRHLISIPAGLGRMPLGRFTLYTLLGATIWNTFLAYVGWQLREHWDAVGPYLKIGDVLVIAIALGAAGYFVYKFWKKRRAK